VRAASPPGRTSSRCSKAHRRAWQDGELPLGEDWPHVADPGPSAHGTAERAELLRALHEVPIDVLAERRETTRGALYKTLHDARQRLRAALADRDLGGRT
jgi:RNA polymerase sigma-70 factor, ECF subfamily